MGIDNQICMYGNKHPPNYFYTKLRRATMNIMHERSKNIASNTIILYHPAPVLKLKAGHAELMHPQTFRFPKARSVIFHA